MQALAPCCLCRSKESQETHKDLKVDSVDAVQRHIAAAQDDPSLLVYNVSGFPNTAVNQKASRGSDVLPRAVHIPPNSSRGVPVETDGFVGHALFLQAPPRGSQSSGNSPYHHHFFNRRRLWELRLQGRFRRKPEGDLFVGMILKDFNYNQRIARWSRTVARLGLKLTNWNFYFSWGDRCEAAELPDAELSHVSTGMAGMDQVIVTPAGQKPPQITDELHGEGYERKAMGTEPYKKVINSVVESINTTDTYTFCYWGPSQCVDALNWEFRFGMNISMSDFLEEWPVHLAIYELPVGDVRHLESRKRYFLDIMFWSTRVACKEHLARYRILDAPDNMEEETIAFAQSYRDGAHSGDGQPQQLNTRSPIMKPRGSLRGLFWQLRPALPATSSSSSSSTRDASECGSTGEETEEDPCALGR